MKDETIDKIISKTERAYLYAQVIFSWMVIIFGISYAIRCICEKTDAIYVILFSAMAYVGYSLLLRASMQELREARKADKK